MQKNGMNGLSAMTARCSRNNGAAEAAMRMVWMDRGRRCGGRALGIAVGITMLVLLMAGGAGALSNSGGGSWQYSKDITTQAAR